MIVRPMTVYVLTFRGIDEKLVGNLLDQYVDALPVWWQRIEVPWLAQYGNGASYAQSLAQGMQLGRNMIAEILARDPDARIVLAGYSGGAALAGDLANEFVGKVTVSVLVADPNDVGDANEFGIAGRRAVRGRHLRVAARGDAIPRCPRLSPLRPLALLSPHMALGDRAVWARDVRRKLADPKVRAEIAAQIGPPWSPLTWARYDRARIDVDNYLSGRGHVRAYTDRVGGQSMLTRAAQWTATAVI
ncbi:lysin B [Gordonia phage Verity]|uniref:Lysin B n=1 Tax=Gordonia phage Verity TaxID=2591211 RepID=A0A514DIV1_9CAUD|nr:lysin B [Gordonia phage Verity]QDH93532.1 lysin B [Gordonia phage Verity]QPO16889.1 lysin B [Gordonia phage Delrey21]QXN74172.1 lysin B [Gordonia phage DoctorFroggo]